ncbi:MFS transporter [Cellulomonas fengjieae]|uniref:MFS transporter n=1 Tax=Cellulomonas fengjieae TaxID=2819978 RepID=A0ABS3SB79_9CELL|nr:MFS transporter [Cellulomonas fengjieae]MBO3083013.1 MFS transporter [Cellulomonas fengjieae]QVI65616.1 MFS transporter [Cellulomonas fengjieae]
MTVTDLPPGALPRSYLTWLTGFTVSRLGDAVLMFALGWAASGLGGTTAALVLTLTGLPRVILLVVGGAVADRVGARRILIAGEAAMLALSVALAVALARFGTPTWLLLTSSLALGTVTAFCLPAAGSQPRRLVPDDQLPRALALRQGSGQAVLMGAAPLGGLLVGTVGLPAIAWGDAVTLGVGLCVLVAVRDMSSPASDAVSTAASRTVRLDLVDGFRVVGRTPGLRRALILVGAGAALMLPVPSLLVPLLGRASSWGPGSTGVVAGAVGVGVISAAVLTARRRRPPPRTAGGARAAAGLAVSAVGAFLLATGPALVGPDGVAVAIVGALVFGFGNGTFVARLAPLVLGSAPRTHLARVQALVGLVQLVPVMVTNTILGALAQHASPGWALGATSAGLAACAAWAYRLRLYDDGVSAGPAAREQHDDRLPAR